MVRMSWQFAGCDADADSGSITVKFNPVSRSWSTRKCGSGN